jgi:hypothetical protein
MANRSHKARRERRLSRVSFAVKYHLRQSWINEQLRGPAKCSLS